MTRRDPATDEALDRAGQAIAIVYAVAAVYAPAGAAADCCVFCMGPWTGRGSHCDHTEWCAWVAARRFAGKLVP